MQEGDQRAHLPLANTRESAFRCTRSINTTVSHVRCIHSAYQSFPSLTQAATAKDPLCRLFARMSLAGLPRGGGDGDAIRHGILNIMRGNGIKEGHRPVRPTH